MTNVQETQTDMRVLGNTILFADNRYSPTFNNLAAQHNQASKEREGIREPLPSHQGRGGLPTEQIKTTTTTTTTGIDPSKELGLADERRHG
jgi:hypothetical protein